MFCFLKVEKYEILIILHILGGFYTYKKTGIPLFFTNKNYDGLQYMAERNFETPFFMKLFIMFSQCRKLSMEPINNFKNCLDFVKQSFMKSGVWCITWMQYLDELLIIGAERTLWIIISILKWITLSIFLINKIK